MGAGALCDRAQPEHHYRPYDDDRDDSVAVCANAVLFLNIAAGLLIKLDVVGDDKYDLPPDGTDGYNKGSFYAVLMLINVIVVGFAAVTIFRQMITRGMEDSDGAGGSRRGNHGRHRNRHRHRDRDRDREIEMSVEMAEIDASVERLARVASEQGGSFARERGDLFSFVKPANISRSASPPPSRRRSEKKLVVHDSRAVQAEI